MLYKKLLVLPLMLASYVTYAGPKAVSEGPEEPCETTGQIGKQVAFAAELNRKISGGPCPDPSKLLGICGDISRQSQADPEGPYEYDYEQKIYEAACADPEKPEDIKKIQTMWMKLDKNLKCQSAGDFIVGEGSVLKYAVRMQTYDLLDRAASIWKVNLNVIDGSGKHNGTLLDYVQYEINEQQGKTQEMALRTYYNILRRSGAKHKSELQK